MSVGGLYPLLGGVKSSVLQQLSAQTVWRKKPDTNQK